jgi:uncharacterized membrane protein YkvA (DUF1232 family)
VAGYSLSLIDLIPNFITVLGYLDDLALIPLRVLLMIRLVPAVVALLGRVRRDKD